MSLITLADYKALMGVQAGDTRNDTQISALLAPVSQAIASFTGRDFTVTSGISSDKAFLYDGSGILDIDDATTVTNVTVNIPNVTPYVLSSDEYQVMPSGGLVYYYIQILGGPWFGASPEMGFTRNLDRYPALQYKQPTITVTGVWGWPAIPEDVKYATALTLQEFMASSSRGKGGGDLTAEAIEGFSRSWGGGPGAMGFAIPNRARDILAAYQRIFT